MVLKEEEHAVLMLKSILVDRRRLREGDSQEEEKAWEHLRLPCTLSHCRHPPTQGAGRAHDIG